MTQPFNWNRIDAVFLEETGIFHNLVIASGLDKSRDFRNLKLRGFDFTEADLRGFDFSGSDLRGTNIELCSKIDDTTIIDRSTLIDDSARLFVEKNTKSEIFNIIKAEIQKESIDHLIERNNALLAAEKLRNEFMHHVSYELRSPLTNIIGFIQLLDDPAIGPLNAKQREYAGYVMKSSSALLAIINDILDLASIDADAMELSLDDVDIAQTMRAAAEGVQDRLGESSLTLRVAMLEGIGSFVADGKRIRQILFSLLSNAIGFSSPGQAITLGVSRLENEVVFTVTDEGSGIPPEILEHVFERFKPYTAGSRPRGVGLGLSIVRAFVELHGGKVLIDSALGGGTTVTCVFPLVATSNPKSKELQQGNGFT
jgi:signal transduction histidine kinase